MARPKTIKSEARKKLSDKQIAFAEWLALPSLTREPKKQTDLADKIGVTEQTLCNWKRVPEIITVRNEILGTLGKELVPEAIGALGDLLRVEIKCPHCNKRIKVVGAATIASAKEILDRYSEATKESTVIASIKDMYDQFRGG